MNKPTKTTVIINFLWRFLERCGAQAVSVIVSIILARLLEPQYFGTIALVTVFTTIMQVFVDSGLGNALIQKKDADSIDFSSVFYCNIVAGICMYIIIYSLAPHITEFYQIPELTKIIRVLAITLIIASVKNIQQAYVSKELMFKKFFFATLLGTIIAAFIGIWMAYNNYGVWALVTQHLVNSAVDTIVLWFTVKWRPTLEFSFTRLKTLFSFGWKLLISSLLDVSYRDLRSLIIGKLYTRAELAFYDRGNLFPKAIVNNINHSINSVLFPTMSRAQNNPVLLKYMTRQSISIATYLIAPFLVGIAVCAETIVKIILTEKWLDCVFFIRIFCFTYCFYPIHTANLNAIKALGRSDIFLKLEIIKKILGLIFLLSTVFVSVKALAYSMLLTSILGQIINSWPNKKLLNYGYCEQIKDIAPSLLLATTMGIIIYPYTYIIKSESLLLIIQILSGIIFYLLGSKIFKTNNYNYIINLIQSIHKKN